MLSNNYLKKDTAALIKLHNAADTNIRIKGNILVELIERSERLVNSTSSDSKKHKEDIKHSVDLIISNYILFKKRFDEKNFESDLINAYGYFKHFDFLVRHDYISKDFLYSNTDKNFLKVVEITRREYLNSAKKNSEKGDFDKALGEIISSEALGVFSQEKLIKKYVIEILLDKALNLISNENKYVEAIHYYRNAKQLGSKSYEKGALIRAEYTGYLARRHAEDAQKETNIKEKMLHYIKAKRYILLSAVDDCYSRKVYLKNEKYYDICNNGIKAIEIKQLGLFDEIDSQLIKIADHSNPYSFFYSTDSEGNYCPMKYCDHIKLFNKMNGVSQGTSTHTEHASNFDYDTSDYSNSSTDEEPTPIDYSYEIHELEEQIKQNAHEQFVEEEKRKDDEHWQYYEEMGID